jgi:membrane-associated protease RseP (regulator of RpoE activity)
VKTTPFPPPQPGTDASKRGFDRFRNEVMAGGSVTERDDDADRDGEGAPASRATSILAGVLVLGLFVWLAFVNVWMFVFAVGIVISVFLHETGHFVTARMTGMKATQFFLGFGPRLWSFKRGETEYGVRALPIGAFVRIIGMNNLDEVPPQDEGRTYRQATFPRRMLVITAGSLMHLLIAIGLLFAIYVAKGELTEAPGATVAAAEAGAPAAAGGIEAGDVILSVGGVPVDGADGLGEAVRSHQPGDVVPVVVERAGSEQTIDVTLGTNTDPQSPNHNAAFLGVSSHGTTTWVEKSVPDAAVSSVTDVFPLAWESAQGLVKVLNPVSIVDHLTGENEDITTRPTTVVGATQVSGSIGDSQGIFGVLYVLAALNIFVGLFNMLPLLPLDGGHAAVAVYERTRERDGRRYFADVSKLMPVAMGVIVVLALLFMSGLYLDIARPLG